MSLVGLCSLGSYILALTVALQLHEEEAWLLSVAFYACPGVEGREGDLCPGSLARVQQAKLLQAPRPQELRRPHIHLQLQGPGPKSAWWWTAAWAVHPISKPQGPHLESGQNA